MDLLLKISKTILDTNYKTPEELAEYLNVQFSIMSVMKADNDKKAIVKEMEILNANMNKLRAEIQKTKLDQKKGRVIDISLLAKKENTLKDMGARTELLKNKLSAIKHEAIQGSNALHNSKNELFIRKVSERLTAEFGAEKRAEIFYGCNVTLEEVSERMLIKKGGD